MTELLHFPKEIIRECIGKTFNIHDIKNLYDSCPTFKLLVQKYYSYNNTH